MASTVVLPAAGGAITDEQLRSTMVAFKADIEALQGGEGVLAAEIVAADAGGFTAQTTVEAQLQELYQDTLSTMGFIDVPLATLRETTTFDVGDVTANGGILASDTTPILSAINDATDGCQRVTWASSNNDQVMFQFACPPDLDDTADLKLYTRIASGGTTNAVGFTVASFFDEADTAVSDTSATNQTVTYTNALTTIAAADFPAFSTCTIGLTPVAHTTDTLNLTMIRIYYKKKLLTS